jgi:hypothetical protein
MDVMAVASASVTSRWSLNLNQTTAKEVTGHESTMTSPVQGWCMQWCNGMLLSICTAITCISLTQLVF